MFSLVLKLITLLIPFLFFSAEIVLNFLLFAI